MIKGKFLYGGSVKTTLFSLVFETVGNTVYVVSIGVAYTLSRLFLSATVS